MSEQDPSKQTRSISDTHERGVLYIMDLAGIHDLKNTGFLFIWPSDLVMLTPPSSEGVVRRPGYRWKAVDLLCTLKRLVFVVSIGKKVVVKNAPVTIIFDNWHRHTLSC